MIAQIYTIQFSHGTLAEYSDTSNVLEVALALSPISNPTILPNWIQGSANATLFLSSMPKPSHGKLFLNQDNQL